MEKGLVNMVVLLMLGGATVGLASASAGETVRGTASYRERMALPPQAVLEVSLQDVSRADAPATTLGSVRIEDPGNPPFEFEIPYDPAVVDERFSYSVRATIRVGERLMFTTDTAYPVLTRGAGSEVDLMLRLVEQQTTSELFNTRWKLLRIGEEEVTVVENQTEPHLVLNSVEQQVRGFGGCNQFHGTYEIDGQSITFGQMAATRKACISGNETEHAFLKALGEAATFRHRGHLLALLDADGAVLAQFEARYLQ